MLLRVIRVSWKHRDIWKNPSRIIRKISWRQYAIQVFTQKISVQHLIVTLDLQEMNVLFELETIYSRFCYSCNYWVFSSFLFCLSFNPLFFSCLFAYICLLAYTILLLLIVLYWVLHQINVFFRFFAFTYLFILLIMGK